MPKLKYDESLPGRAGEYAAGGWLSKMALV
jgi:hypothetical protein